MPWNRSALMVLPVRQKWQVLSPRCVPFLFDTHNANSHKIFHSIHCKGVEEMHYNSILQWGGLERVCFVVFVIKSGEFEPLGWILRLSCCVCVELSLQLSCYVLHRYRGHACALGYYCKKPKALEWVIRCISLPEQNGKSLARGVIHVCCVACFIP